MTPKEYAAHLSTGLDGPHDDGRTADVAALAAQALRYLAYATRPDTEGVTSPVTVYDVATELAAAISRLPQVVSQLGDWLAAEDAGGRIGTGRIDAVDDARMALSEAGYAAERLNALLWEAANATSYLRPTQGGKAR
jgi:hypothetical protein